MLSAFKVNNIDVIGVASKNIIKARKTGKEKKIDFIYQNWKNLVQDTKIDIVAIAVPAIYQIEIIKECLKFKKIILCEKPIGIKKIEIDKLFLLLIKYKKLFLVDYIFPEHQAFKKFIKIIKNRKQYKEDFIKINFNTKTYINKHNIKSWKTKKNRGGGIINLFLSHITDYLILYFGKIKKIDCCIKKIRNVEINLQCNIIFNSGIRATIFINTDHTYKSHSIEYYSKRYNLILINRGKDYAKNFKIFLSKIDNKNDKIVKEIGYEDHIKKYKSDSRIILSSRIIKKFKKQTKSINMKNNIDRFRYNENILEDCRISAKKLK